MSIFGTEQDLRTTQASVKKLDPLAYVLKIFKLKLDQTYICFEFFKST
jgi:hypothetical protein